MPVDLEGVFAAVKLVSAPQSLGTECCSASPGGFMFGGMKTSLQKPCQVLLVPLMQISLKTDICQL